MTHVPNSASPPVGRGWPTHDADVDPGNLADLVPEILQARVRVEHVALGGGLHVLPDDLDRIEADLIAEARWRIGGVR